MPRPGVSKGGPLKNCEGFHVAEAQGVKGSGGGKRGGAGGSDSVRGVSGTKAAGAGWPDRPDAEPEVRGGDGNVRTDSENVCKALIRDWEWSEVGGG